MNINCIIAFHFCVKCTLRSLLALRATLSRSHNAHTVSTHLGITHNGSYIILQREAPAALVTEHRQYIEKCTE